MVVGGCRPVRGVKHDVDVLDDEDLAVIGRAFSSATPRQTLSAVGAVVGVTAGVALSMVSPVGAALVLVGLPAFAVAMGRRDVRAVLEDQGLSSGLAAEFVAASTFLTTLRANLTTGMLTRPIPRDPDYVRFAEALVAAVRARRARPPRG
jgi:hypothetical protein